MTILARQMIPPSKARATPLIWLACGPLRFIRSPGVLVSLPDKLIQADAA